jgi:hypothetical protein
VASIDKKIRESVVINLENVLYKVISSVIFRIGNMSLIEVEQAA